MQYFPINKPCPMTPIKKVDGDSLLALIHLPSGGFNCIALPLEALDAENEQT
jgi:hypothetical protein